jgi:hypothetical protein
MLNALPRLAPPVLTSTLAALPKRSIAPKEVLRYYDLLS